MAKATKTKTIALLGEHGRRIRVFKDGELYRIQCRALGIFHSYRGPGARDKALAFGKRLEQRGERGPELLTVGDLWAKYTASASYRELRPKTQQLYREYWSTFVAVVPEATPVDSVTRATLHEVRTALETTPTKRCPHGMALATIRHVIGTVKTVWNWGEGVEAIARNRIHAFRFVVGKDRQQESPAEYTRDEFERLLAALSFDRITERTPYCVLALIGSQGVRINAALHLRWEDVSWTDELLVWRAPWDKMGREWDQPMRKLTRAVLGRLWAAEGEPTEGWVFPARHGKNKGAVYTVGAFWSALKAAEVRAGVEAKRYRAAHGFRRMIAGDLVDATGSAQMAMEGIGDRSVKMAERYVKRRRGRTARALAELDKGAA